MRLAGPDDVQGTALMRERRVKRAGGGASELLRNREGERAERATKRRRASEVHMITKRVANEQAMQNERGIIAK